ncbi:MAG: ribonuclease HII [Desulfocapsaceae bacterium]|nr:ribonuclease HII [Desulfocapsaceae bacterium]
MKHLLPESSLQADNFQFERMLGKRGFSRIAGTDEVGRGPLAGPVVAASVILPESCSPSLFRDSKITTEKQRYQLRDKLLSANTPVGIGIVSPHVIDQINILQASLLAMKESILDLSSKAVTPDFVLVDGTFCIPLDISQEPLVRGDSRSATISAASIIAKITRDEIMKTLHERFPQYHFSSNKGYPTRQHRKALFLHGPCAEHRFSFKGVKDFVKTAN